MHVINAENINDALPKGIDLIHDEGMLRKSRNGTVIEVPCPVATVYNNPDQMVLFNPVRNCNHFFHFFEALWILAGRSDVDFLAQFNPRMRDYSDDGVVFNAPYGYRIRSAFAFDQLGTIIHNLNKNSDSRQEVLQIWDVKDLHKTTKDKACNLSVCFKIRAGQLYMTVYNRSNDVLWGAYGANVVQFSTLMWYVARQTGTRLGKYTQVSDSFHIYTEGTPGKLWNKLLVNSWNPDPYSYGIVEPGIQPGCLNFESDLLNFFSTWDKNKTLRDCFYGVQYHSSYFNGVVVPMAMVWDAYKHSNDRNVYEAAVEEIKSSDWKLAAQQWLKRRGLI